MKINIIKSLPIAAAALSALACCVLQAESFDTESNPRPGLFEHGPRLGQENGPKGKMDPGRHLLRIADRLELTDEQELAILKISQQYRAELDAHFESSRDARESLKYMRESRSFDEDTFRQVMAKIQPSMVEGMVLHAKYKDELADVLTEDQLDKLDSMKAKMKARGQHLKEGYGKRGEKLKRMKSRWNSCRSEVSPT